jgi:hypothetical protein
VEDVLVGGKEPVCGSEGNGAGVVALLLVADALVGGRGNEEVDMTFAVAAVATG